MDPKKTVKLDEYVDLLVELRKNKGMTPEKATEVVDRHLAKGIVLAKYTLSATAL